MQDPGRCPISANLGWGILAMRPDGPTATSRGQHPRMAIRNGMRPGGCAGNRTVSAANFVADSASNPIPGALPPASGHWPFGPFRINSQPAKLALMGRCPGLACGRTVGAPILDAASAGMLVFNKAGTPGDRRGSDPRRAASSRRSRRRSRLSRSTGGCPCCRRFST